MNKTKLIRKYLSDFPDLSNKEIAQLFKKEHNVDDSIEKLSNLISKAKRSRPNAELSFVPKKEAKWKVEDGEYMWRTSRGEIKMTVSFIDNLFYEYSEHGLNLSQTEIINKHNLKVWEWSSIKNTLQLYKKSHIFSPYTVENTDPKELEEMVAKKIDKVFTSIGYQVEQQYNKRLRKEYKKTIAANAEKDLFQKTVLLELEDFFKNQPDPEYRPVINVVQNSGNKIINVFIFDVHFGAEARTELLPQYSPQLVNEMFDKIARQVNDLNAKEVHIWFGGDNIETFTGMNHPDSWRGIAKGYYGSELIKRAYKAFVRFISSVNNVKAIYAVPGNHDRATEDSKSDNQGWMADILFELIRLAFKEKLPVKYNEKVVNESVDGVHYIMSHGHKKMTNLPAAELILEYGDPYKFNLLVSGHLHNRSVKKDHKNFRQIVSPSLFVGNDYSIDNGWTSSSGYLIAYNNGFNKPTIIDNTL